MRSQPERKKESHRWPLCLLAACGMLLASGGAVLADYNATLDSQSCPTFSLKKGTKASVWVWLNNTGSDTWGGSNPVRVGTAAPLNRSSPFCDSTWIACHRPGGLEAEVPPGQTGHFAFVIQVPSTTGTYTEQFQLLCEGVTWFGPVFPWTITVTDGDVQGPSVAPTPTIGATSCKIQAEDYDYGGEGIAWHDGTPGFYCGGNYCGRYRWDDVDIETCQDTGGGYTLAWTEPGEWLEYTVNVATAGNYQIRLREATVEPGTYQFSMNGAAITGVQYVVITGDWQTYATTSPVPVSLSAGNNQILRCSMVGGEFNLNWILIEPAGCASPVIAANPSDATKVVGQTASFQVTATGTSLGYQWQKKPSGGDWADVSGATSDQYTTATLQLSDSGSQYHCVVSNSCGSQTSNAATLTVLESFPTGALAIDPSDGHRFVMDDQFWYLAGYYPSIAALTADQTDYVNYYKNLINKQSANRVNYFRNVLTMGQPYGDAMVPYLRTGPGTANDGRPKFNLYSVPPAFNDAYFTYWRNVITYAQSKGVVVQVCIFDTWHNKAWVTENNGDIQHEWGMKHDFYNGANNINGLDVSDITQWTNPSHPVFDYQKRFIEQVVRTVGDLPNIIYEISNENYYNANWEIQLAEYLTTYEASQGFARHLVMPRDLPNHDGAGGKGNNPSTVHSEMVSKYSMNKPLIADNDGGGEVDTTGRRQKVWAALTAGGHVDYFHFNMYQQSVLDSSDVTVGMRYIGYTGKFISDLSVDMRGMQPSDGLVTNGWCYAKSGEKYIIYLMNGGSTTVSGLPGSYTATWFNPRDGVSQAASGGPTFTCLDGGDWVLYIKAGDDAQHVGNTIPSEMEHGEQVSVDITMKNTGTTTWTAAAGYHLGAVGDSDPFAAARHDLTAGESIAPGEQKTFTFMMTAPSTPAVYTTDWRMLRESMGWFGETLTKQVQVVGPPPVPGDFDGDEDVDQEDFGVFQACFSGSASPYEAGCEKADLDTDGDVDAGDFGILEGCMGGADQPPGC